MVDLLTDPNNLQVYNAFSLGTVVSASETYLTFYPTRINFYLDYLQGRVQLPTGGKADKQLSPRALSVTERSADLV